MLSRLTRSFGGIRAFSAVAPFERFLGRSIESGQGVDLSFDELVHLLGSKDDELLNGLYSHANSIATSVFNNRIVFRGLIEVSNVCQKNCSYCGIRRDADPFRYTMEKDEVVDAALWAHEKQFGSIMIQSGEVVTRKRMDFILECLDEIMEKTTAIDGKGLGISISLGELPKEYYDELIRAGARRYLLRIESSNPELYGSLHPNDGQHTFEQRMDALKDLKDAGFQTGTGVMIGTPNQTLEDLAGDVIFFRDFGVHMIGMGPYVLESSTPLGKVWIEDRRKRNPGKSDDQILAEYGDWAFETTTKMIALSRCMLPSANIAATTALQTLNPTGREIAITRGANVMMPNITPTKYRESYQLYQGKTAVKDDPTKSLKKLESEVESVGKTVGWGEWGDPPQYYGRGSTFEDAKDASHIPLWTYSS
eukprot:TRINITY_DN6841_c0_g1_i1.p1 TRINITY_DN6841_c0_g1~~TRINITY_DN6841_c0_g1_i1.p1  ORF type:complete len:422 (+),score=121.32 TRINITY_DN6841_c0_g1_i1:46-1311(+)